MLTWLLVGLLEGTMSALGCSEVEAEGEEGTRTSTQRAVAEVAADLALIGACGIDAAFGLSADDPDEAALKTAMIETSARAAVLTGAAKIGRRARHRVVECTALHLLVTDATVEQTADLEDTGLEVRHA